MSYHRIVGHCQAFDWAVIGVHGILTLQNWYHCVKYLPPIIIMFYIMYYGNGFVISSDAQNEYDIIQVLHMSHGSSQHWLNCKYPAYELYTKSKL